MRYGPEIERSNEAGFSILEAMIAMALLAAALLPLLELQGQFTRVVGSLERADMRLQARDVALNKIITINPAENLRGELELQDSRISWMAQPVFPLKPLNDSGFDTPTDIALYDIKVEILFVDGSYDNFNVRRLGWVSEDFLQSILE